MTLFILAVIGLTQILVASEIMDPVDDWARTWMPSKVHHGLFECYQCAGFWCGVLLGVLMVSLNPMTVLACGCAGSFLADLSESLFKFLESSNAS